MDKLLSMLSLTSDAHAAPAASTSTSAKTNKQEETAELKPHNPLHTYPLFPEKLPPEDHTHLKRRTMKQMKNNILFEVPNFFSEKECRYMIAESERIGFSGIEWEYTPDYRQCDRLVARSQPLADLIWKRLLPLMTRDDVAEVRPFGFGAEGVWQPLGINDVIRFTRYSPGGHFQMHRDGAFVLNDEIRSIFTVMAYLNDDYKGGATRFQEEAAGAETRGAAGSLLVFNHDVQHEGLPVKSGRKYIMRTDVMFRRIDTEVPLLAYKDNVYYKEACVLYDKSIALQKAGDPRGSTEAYLAALDAQAKLRSMPIPVGPEVQALPSELYALIFRMLSTQDLLRAAKVSRGWRRLTRDSRIWRERYLKRWPDHFPYETIVTEGHVKDWYVSYKNHHIACRDFPIVVVDLGHAAVKAVACDTGKQLCVASVVCQHAGHYWGAGEGLANVQLGYYERDQWVHEYEAYKPATKVKLERGMIMLFDSRGPSVPPNQTWRADPISLPLPQRLRVAIMWCEQIGLHTGTKWHPLLVALCPSWSQDLVHALRHELCFTRRNATDNIPFYAQVYSPVLVALAHKKPNAVVVALGAHATYACYVWDGAYVASSYTEIVPKGEEQAATLVTDSAKLPKIRTAINACISAAPAARQAELWKNIIVTGGRTNATIVAAIKASLADAPQAELVASEKPQYDVISGGRALSHLSTARDIFTPVRSLLKIDTSRPVVLARLEWGCPVQRAIAVLETGERALFRRFENENAMEMYLEQHRDILFRCPHVFIVVTARVNLKWSRMEDERKRHYSLFARLSARGYGDKLQVVLFNPTEEKDQSTLCEQEDVPPGVKVFHGQKETRTYLAGFVGGEIPFVK